MLKYKHTQIGYTIIFTFLLALIVISMTFYLEKVPMGTWVAMILFIIVIELLFATLMVEIDEENIKLKFGIGIISKKFFLKDIKSYCIVKNKWYNGWGIHGHPGKGWLYNVSGFDAVEIRMEDGMIYRIGTDEPEILAKAIATVTGKSIINDDGKIQSNF
jgi:hypothetical protein